MLMKAHPFLLLWIVLAIPVVASAHTDPATGQDYSGFERNDGKGSCCDWHDCRPAHEPFMEQDGEKITDRANNKFLFDPAKVVGRPSDDGNWHVCASATTLRCIIAPAQSYRQPQRPERLFGWSTPAIPFGQRPFSQNSAGQGITSATLACMAPLP
jgi:hypothetical protein